MESPPANADDPAATDAEPTDADVSIADAADGDADRAPYERPPGAKRSWGYDQRKQAAVGMGRTIGRVPGGVAFLKLFHLSIKLLYPPLVHLGRLTRQSERVGRWIAESEEVMATYYAGARGETPFADDSDESADA